MRLSDGEIIVLVKHQNRYQWFISERDFWVLDQESWRRAFVEAGYDEGDASHAERFMIAQDGLWALVVMAESKTERTKSGLVAKTLLGLTNKDAADFARSIPGVVWRGTKGEVEWLRHHLGCCGIPATIEKAGLASADNVNEG